MTHVTTTLVLAYSNTEVGKDFPQLFHGGRQTEGNAKNLNNDLKPPRSNGTEKTETLASIKNFLGQ